MRLEKCQGNLRKRGKCRFATLKREKKTLTININYTLPSQSYGDAVVGSRKDRWLDGWMLGLTGWMDRWIHAT